MRIDQFQLFLMVDRIDGVYDKTAFDALCTDGGFDVVDAWSFMMAIGQVVFSRQMYPDKPDALDRYNTMMREVSVLQPQQVVSDKPCCGGGEVK